MVRFFPIADWAPAQEAIYDEPSRMPSLPTNPDSFHPLELDPEPEHAPEPESVDPHSRQAVPGDQRFRSMSVSHAWRMRPKSPAFGPEDLISRLPELALEDTRSSHGSVGGGEPGADGVHGNNGGSGGKGKNPLRGMIRRASVSLKHLVPRRTSIATSTGEDHQQAHARRFVRSSHDHHAYASPSNGHRSPFSTTHSHTHSPSTTTPPNHADTFAMPSPSSSSRPATAHSSAWRRLREAASFRHSRGTNLDTVESRRASAFLTAPVPGSGTAPPIIPRNTGGAARAAAADAAFHADALRRLTPAEWALNMAATNNGLGSSSGIYNSQNNALNNSSSNDGESGIGITVTPTESEEEEREKADSRLGFVGPSGLDPLDMFCEHGNAAGALMRRGSNGRSYATRCCGRAPSMDEIPRVDFVARLPTELAIQVLSYLGCKDLATVALVSRIWKHVSADQHIWRESFLREMTSTYATSGSVRPGAGLGIPAVRPGNDWVAVYKARMELERRWKAGIASPVYLNGHTDSIYCLQFDESKIITGSRDKTIRVWDMHTLSCRLVIGPPHVIRDPRLLHDRDGLPTHFATTENHPRTNPSSPACVSFPTHHNASILCLQYDDRILVTGSSDATCIVHSLSSAYRPIRRLRHHSGAVLDLVFDEKRIVTCSKDLSICIWDRESGSLLMQIHGHAGPVNAVQMRGDTVVSCSGDFLVKLWNISTGTCIREFWGHTKGLACSQFSEDGRYVASAGNDRTIRVWDANTGECVREMKAHENLVRSLHIDSVSGRLVSGSYDTDIMVFDMESGRQLLHFPKWHASWVLSAKSDYRRIISTGQDPKILVMDFGKGVPGIEMLESPGARNTTEEDFNILASSSSSSSSSASSSPSLEAFDLYQQQQHTDSTGYI